MVAKNLRGFSTKKPIVMVQPNSNSSKYSNGAWTFPTHYQCDFGQVWASWNLHEPPFSHLWNGDHTACLPGDLSVVYNNIQYVSTESAWHIVSKHWMVYILYIACFPGGPVVKNPMDRGAWQATVHRITRVTWLSNWTATNFIQPVFYHNRSTCTRYFAVWLFCFILFCFMV